MRMTTIATIGLFAASAVTCAYSVTVVNNNLDLGVPVITMEEDSIDVSIHDDDSVILAGIRAEDSEDGDITDSLVVENLSNFLEKGERKASIVAFDSANHISRAYREIHYTDYTSPRFSLEEPLRFSKDTYNYMGTLEVEDCLDGDITNKLHMTYNEDPKEGQENVSVTYSVSNTLGDTVTLPVTITLYDPLEEGQRPGIVLTDYLIYVDKDKKVDPRDYISQIHMSGMTFKNRKGKLTRIGTPANSEPEYLDDDLLKIKKGKPVDGVYEITYKVTDLRDEEDESDDTTQTVRLIVVTEE